MMATENRNPSDKRNPGEKHNMNDRNQNENRNPGNFAQNPERAAEAGRKGGEHSHGGQQDNSQKR